MIVWDITTLRGMLASIREQHRAAPSDSPEAPLELWRATLDRLDPDELAPNDLAQVVVALPEEMRLQGCMELAELTLVFEGLVFTGSERPVRAVNAAFLNQYLRATLGDAFPELCRVLLVLVDELGRGLPSYTPVTS